MISNAQFLPTSDEFVDEVIHRSRCRNPGEVDIVMLGLKQYGSNQLITLDFDLEGEVIVDDEFIFERLVDNTFGDDGPYERPWYFGIAVPMSVPRLMGSPRMTIAYASIERMAVKVGSIPVALDMPAQQLRVVGEPNPNLHDVEINVLMQYILALRKHVVHQG